MDGSRERLLRRQFEMLGAIYGQNKIRIEKKLNKIQIQLVGAADMPEDTAAERSEKALRIKGISDALQERASSIRTSQGELVEMGRKVALNLIAVRHGAPDVDDEKALDPGCYLAFANQRKTRYWPLSDPGNCVSCGRRPRDMIFCPTCTFTGQRVSTCECNARDGIHPWCSRCLRDCFTRQLGEFKLYSFDFEQVTCLLRCPVCEAQVCPFDYVPFESHFEPFVQSVLEWEPNVFFQKGQADVTLCSLDDVDLWGGRVDIIERKMELLNQNMGKLLKVIECVNDSGMPLIVAQTDPDKNKKLRNKIIYCYICDRTWDYDEEGAHYPKKCPDGDHMTDDEKQILKNLRKKKYSPSVKRIKTEENN